MDALRTQVTTHIQEAEWGILLDSDPSATCFHRPEFSSIVARHHPQWQPRWIEARRGSDLVAALPFHLRSRAGILDVVSGWGGSYGGPVGSDSAASSAVVESLLGHHRWRRRRIEAVWAGALSPGGAWTPLESAVLDPGSFDDFDDFLRQRFPKNRRNECTRSTKRGLRVECDCDGQHLDDVWSIYRDQCEKWGSPPVEHGLWRELLDAFEEAILFVAIDENEEVVGGHLCVGLPGELFAWLGTTKRMDRVFPSSLLIREEARHVHASGMKALNLGSSMGLGGVQNYKQLLGARLESRWILRECAWWWPRRNR